MRCPHSNLVLHPHAAQAGDAEALKSVPEAAVKAAKVNVDPNHGKYV